MKPKLLLSLHDVAPFHLARLRKAEALFKQWGVTQIAYLFVPRYHRGDPAETHAEFRRFCTEGRPFAVDWLLHGFYHLETPQPAASEAPRSAWLDGLKRRFMTAGEGEFLALNADETARRLAEGQASFADCLGRPARGFIPPAWLHGPALFDRLGEAGFAYSENHAGLHFLRAAPQTHRFVPSPVVTWATRTWLRRKGSLVVCPSLEWLHRKDPADQPLRVAMHPFDFDFPETVASLEAVVKRLLSRRESITWEQLQ